MISKSQLFKAVQHNVRQEILSRLDTSNEMTYSQFLDLTEGSTGKLNYHLRILGDLVEKTERGYTLSDYGQRVKLWLNTLYEVGNFRGERPEVVIEPFYPMKELRTKYLLFLIAALIFSFILSLIFFIWASPIIFIVGVGTGFFIHSYCTSIIYFMDEAEIIVSKGIITRTNKVVPYRTITNIELAVGPFDRIWGMSTIKIYTAGNNFKRGAEEELIGLADGEDIRDAILERITLLNPPRFSENRSFMRILSAVKDVNQELR